MEQLPASALRATLSQALTGLDWSAGMPRVAILDRLAEEPVWRGLLRHYLPEGRYFSVADIIAALPDEVAQDPAAWAQAAASREPFDGVTPEGLGAALRNEAGAGGGNWLGAVARSAFLPGWGQWHNGERFKALAFALLSLALGLASGLPGAMSRAVRGKPLFAPGGRVRALWLLPLAATYVASLFDAFDRAGGRRA